VVIGEVDGIEESIRDQPPDPRPGGFAKRKDKKRRDRHRVIL
jgi:hypothetical protein